jgi:vitamin-K-epoxide reductase (warfarin-sensitive)
MPIAMTSRATIIFTLIAVCAAVGMAVSAIALYHHYGSSKSSYCDFGEKLNCDIVNRSVYSTVFGMPDALIGIVGYAGLLGLATLYRTRTRTPILLLIASLAGLGFALYLTYIEAFVLATWCILCLSSLAMILVIAALSSYLVASSKTSRLKPERI